MRILNDKMKQIAQGNMDVQIDIPQGEVGKISITIDYMLSEIRSLIQRIYHEEQEKGSSKCWRCSRRSGRILYTIR
ncbi:hypothetical protein LJK87_45585 [Paenibacillus sp. P25]|nr:hypothetical protein LJK87_45585 [Paenibacillus sp. P25]